MLEYTRTRAQMNEHTHAITQALSNDNAKDLNITGMCGQNYPVGIGNEVRLT